MKAYVETGGETVPEAQFRGAHAARFRGRMGPPLLALRHPLVSIFCPKCFFSMKNDVVFSPILFPAKIARGKTLLKTTSESTVLFKYGRISEQIMRQSAWKSGCILNASTSHGGTMDVPDPKASRQSRTLAW